jgi:hypothetical protein
MVQKIVNTWLVVDVKSGACRCVRKLRPLTKASELAINLKLNIDVPEQPILTAEGNISLGKTQLSNMMIETLTDASQEETK